MKSHPDRATRASQSAGASIRQRWPRGASGWLAYFTDHCVFGFDRPIDWPQQAADEVSIDQPLNWPSAAPDAPGAEDNVPAAPKDSA